MCVCGKERGRERDELLMEGGGSGVEGREGRGVRQMSRSNLTVLSRPL